MSDKRTNRLKAVAVALILVGMVVLPLARGFQTGFAPAADVIDSVPHAVHHASAKPSGSPDHEGRKQAKPEKPGKHERNDEGD